MKQLRFVILAVTTAATLRAIPAPAQQPVASIDTIALRERARFLSSDALAGRENGKPGQHAAAAYIAGELRRIGVAGGAPDGSYTQRLPLARIDIDRAHTRLVYDNGAASDSIPFGMFVLRGSTRESYRAVSGAPLFLGYVRDVHRAIDTIPTLAGHVAVMFAGGNIDTALTLLERRGVGGVVIIAPTHPVFDRVSGAIGTAPFILTEPVAGPPSRRVPVIVAGPIAAKVMGLIAPPVASRPTLSRLAGTLSLRIEAQAVSIDAHNVIGRLQGSDPSRRDEVVVLQAHYDHVGIGRAVAGDSIYNGFMDNAAGVAAVLATAAALTDSANKGLLPRSVLFLLTTAEETGSLGSAYHVANPTVPLARTVATINIDLPAPLAPPTSWTLEGNDRTLARIAENAVRPFGWKVSAAPAIANSDHWSWIVRGVPSVFVVADSGWQGVTPDEEQRLVDRWWKPHRPDDEWSETFPLAGLRRQVEFLVSIASAYARR